MNADFPNNTLSSKIIYDPNFSPAFRGQQHSHGYLGRGSSLRRSTLGQDSTEITQTVELMKMMRKEGLRNAFNLIIAVLIGLLRKKMKAINEARIFSASARYVSGRANIYQFERALDTQGLRPFEIRGFLSL